MGTIELLEHSQTGIIRLIQDEVTMPRGNDESLAAKMHVEHGSHPNYKKVRKNKMQFEIVHFAGSVKYEINGFFDKNLDALTECTKVMLSQSKVQLLKVLFAKTSGRTTKCVGSVFLKSLQHLIKAIDHTTPQFIRCVKPNSCKQSGIWEDKMIEN